MNADCFSIRCGLAAIALGVACVMTGCQPFDHYDHSLDGPAPPAAEPPRELAKVSLPEYRIEPPDVLQLEVLKLVPLPPYHIETADLLQIDIQGTPADQPISGAYPVDEEGRIQLGPSYGAIRVAGLTVDEAQRAIELHLRQILRLPEVAVQIARPSNVQQVSGQYLVASDGTINLRQYGTVHVAGKTLSEARLAIEQQLSRFFDTPRVSLDVVAYNSKVYYIITSGAGLGDNIVKVPVTGNETVLDALAEVRGLSQMSSTNVWVARPAPHGFYCEQILPVDYEAITRGGSTATNYQLLPGDRVFIAEDRSTALANWIGKVFSPVERVAGALGLTASTIRNFNNINTRTGYGGY
ncbi:MAG: polysaccharide biosynthesis/export family protein [Thermoguttaceae bacterium]|nr:polysaccharide biosynthesis/export family protein [Thermoguttaceae bacterium]